MKHVLGIDLETRSSVDIGDCGVYRYVESPDFQILLLGYAYDDGPVSVLDLTRESVPEGLRHDIESNPDVVKTAWNAAFEMTCFEKFFGHPLDPHEWEDTMITAASCGLPRSLGECGAVLGLPQDAQKDKEGKALIRYFSVPCATKDLLTAGSFHEPQEAPDRWEKYIEYNRQDVVAERAIRELLAAYTPDSTEHEFWCLDQEINRRGVLVDTRLADAAIKINTEHTEKLTAEIKGLTGLENPNSLAQLKQWLGITGSLDKEAVSELLKTATGTQKRVLQIRRELGKSSIAKYEAMKRYLCQDHRVRGLFKFYGGRTGRFAGSGVQLQNLPQNHIEDLEEARETAFTGEEELLEALYGNVPDTLSQLIRTAFIPRPGHIFAVADFSAIEARVIAWMADEQWRQDLFARGGDIYCQSASQMFGVPVEKHGINGHLRQKGKIAELACIARGSKVLTDRGLVPIEQVQLTDKVFDGENYVSHEGVVCLDRQRVISYEGLNATPDHRVYLDDNQLITGCISFENAKESKARLWHPFKHSTAADRRTIDYSVLVYDIRNAGPNHRYTVSNTVVHNCGYGGAVGAMVNMGALKMGLEESELQSIVDAWRAASPNIVQFWYEVGDAVLNAVKYGAVSKLDHGLKVYRTKKLLCIRLPSGRDIRYYDPQITRNKFGNPSVSYMSKDAGKAHWTRVESYGPKFVENIVQATARDCLREAMLRVRRLYPNIVMHIHDEMVVEVPEAEAETALKAICAEMGKPISWAPGLLLRGDGYITPFYKKD